MEEREEAAGVVPTRAGLGQRLGQARLHLSVVLLLVVVSFAQRVGETTFDTKFDLTADPRRALGRSLTLWGTQVDFGGLANQAYGYLFPQGTFFLVGDLLEIPDWVTQRLWSALVLVVAYDGARRLARALGIGRSTVPVIVGLVYALSPRIVGLSGVLTAEILPSALLPWVCLPLVLALTGRMSARRAAVLAGLAVVAMGGVNATENLAALPLPLLLVCSGLRSRPGRRLALWWAGCTTLASLWWMLPLLVLGRYSPPFLDYIETAATTTRTATWSNTVRGAEHWLGYIVIGPGQWWQGAHEMGSVPVLVILGGLIAAVGVAGLSAATMPFRGPLVISLVVGLVAATAGHGGVAGTPYAGEIRDLLNGVLAPFRNVHKVDPLIRLPLALGVGMVCATVAAGVLSRRSVRAAHTRSPFWAAGLVIGLVVASAAPMFANTLRQPGWTQVPQAWREAAAWIDQDGPGTTLVLPSTGIGQQVWGWTVDQPIQGLAASGWVARTQIPLVPSQTIRFLDGIETRLADGRGSKELAATLAAAGVTRVLVRNDVDVAAADVADPARVAAALANSPGITSRISFGDAGFGLPLIQVYRVTGATGAPGAVAAADVPYLVGSPEDVISAREAGVVPAGGHVFLGRPADGASPDVVADGYRRVERQFGRFHDAVSQVMGVGEPGRTHRRSVDFRGAASVPRTYADYTDVARVTATSSAGYADASGPVRPELGPGSVLDADPGTYWRSAPFQRASGQALTFTLTRPRPIAGVHVRAANAPGAGATVTRIAIEAGSSRHEVEVGSDGWATADFAGRMTNRVRVTVIGVRSKDPRAAVALREVVIDGLDTTRRLVVPDVGADGRTSFVFGTEPPRRACSSGPFGTSCAVGAARPGVEQSHLNRTFVLHSGGAWVLRGEATATSTPTTARMLLPLGKALTGVSTSVLADDPAVSAMFAVDGDPTTSWLAASGDLSPVVTLAWPGPRRISRIQVLDSLVDAVTPSEVVIEAGGQTRTVRVGAGALGFFEPIVASSARITLLADRHPESANLSVGVGEIRITGLGGLAHPVAANWRFTSLCGLGPEVSVGARTYRTVVTGTLRDVVAGRTLSWRSCDGPVRLSAGTTDLRVESTGAFTATSVVLASSTARHGSTAQGERLVDTSVALAPTMRIRVAAGPTAILRFAQNANPGWRAELGGRPLRSRVLDGWQQGFEVPAGVSGTVTVWFAPSAGYRVVLALGGAGVAALLLLLLLDLRRPATVLLGPVARRAGGRRLGPGTVALVGLVALGILGGPVVLAAALVAAMGGRWVRSDGFGWAAAVLVLASGIVAAFSATTSSGAPGTAADLLAALGCGLVAGALLVRDTRDD